jgi:hypothetical protein
LSQRDTEAELYANVRIPDDQAAQLRATQCHHLGPRCAKNTSATKANSSVQVMR